MEILVFLYKLTLYGGFPVQVSVKDGERKYPPAFCSKAGKR